MKKRVIVIIAIILAVIIAALTLGLTLSKCTGGKKIVQVVMVDTDKDNDNDTDDDTDDDDDDDDDDSDDEDDDFDPFMSDDITLDLGYDEDVVYKSSELVEDVSELYMLYANNDKDHIATTLYRGMTGSVYWGTEYLDLHAYNQHYTDEMIDKEFARFKELGLRVLRSGLWSEYMFTGDPENPWDADSPEMLRFYEFCKAADKYDLTVAPLFAWNYPAFLYGGGQYLDEVGYLYPREVDEDGNTRVIERWGTYFEYPDVDEMNRRLSEFVVAAMQGFKDHGVTNVEFVFLGNEPHEDGGSATGAFVDYQIDSFRAIHNALKAAGLRDDIKLIGPNQGVQTQRFGLAQAFMQRAPEVFDIYSSHGMTAVENSLADVYESDYTRFSGWVEKMEIHDLLNVKEIWSDEGNANADVYGEHGFDDTWIGVQLCSRYAAINNSGIGGLNVWQIFDQLWPTYYGTGGEYQFGAQVDGAAPSFYKTETPYSALYAISLYSKYMGSNQKGMGYGTSYKSEVEDIDSGLVISTVKRGDGHWSIMVVNNSTDPRTCQINFSESLGGATLYRYRYLASEANPATNFKIPTADCGFTNVGDTLIDTLPGGSVCVYSTYKEIAE